MAIETPFASSAAIKCILSVTKYGISTKYVLTDENMKKILVTLLIFSSIGLGVIAFGVGNRATTRSNPNTDSFTRGQEIDNSSAIVQLKGAPISTNPSTKPPHGKKIDFNSNVVKSYRA